MSSRKNLDETYCGYKCTDILDDMRHICEDCGQITYFPPNDPKCPKCRHLEQRLKFLEEITLNG